jgi:hypothetical protein
VEVRAPVRELAVVGGEREPRLGHISLVHPKAPEREELNVGVNVALVVFLLSVVRVDVRLPGRPSGKDERKGGEGVRCEDCIAKEGSGDEARERLEVDKAAAVGRGGVRAARLSAVGQPTMSSMEGMIAWVKRKAAMWSTMTGTAEGPILTRQPTLLVGRRRVPQKLWGWWSMETPFFSFAARRKP